MLTILRSAADIAHSLVIYLSLRLVLTTILHGQIGSGFRVPVNEANYGYFFSAL
jgi:hypothetical protein